MSAHRTRFRLAGALAAALAAGPAVAQARPQPIMELPALLDMFLLPAGAPEGSVLPWDAGTGPESRVRWPVAGIVEAPQHLQREGFPYHRVGLVAISLNGQPVYKMVFQQREVPGAWRITMLGPRAGVFRVDLVTEGDAATMVLDVPGVLTAAGWTVTAYKCSRETSPAVFGHVVHAITAPGKTPAWIQESWNFGQGTGMTVALMVHYRKDEVDKVECVGR